MRTLNIRASISTMRIFITGSAVLLATLALPLRAQSTTSSLPIGARVRIQARGLPLEGVQGNLLAPVTDTVRLRTDRAQQLAIRVDSLWRLDVRAHVAATPESKRRHGLIGAAYGAAAGAALMLIAQAVWPDCSECRFGPTDAEREQWAREDRMNVVQAALGAAAIGGLLKARRHARRGGPGWVRLVVPKDSLAVDRR